MTEAENIAAGMAGEDAKDAAHGIKVGDRVRDRYRRTFEVSSVTGNCLTGYAVDGTSRMLESFHATKVFKL